jgi:hypothetical protein
MRREAYFVEFQCALGGDLQLSGVKQRLVFIPNRVWDVGIIGNL